MSRDRPVTLYDIEDGASLIKHPIPNSYHNLVQA